MKPPWWDGGVAPERSGWGEFGGVGEIGPKEGGIIRLMPDSGSGGSVVSIRAKYLTRDSDVQSRTAWDSGRVQGDDGDLGGTVEAEGEAHGADAAVDVKLHPVEAIEAFGVFLAH